MVISISQLRQERAEIAAWTILKNNEQYLKIKDNIGQLERQLDNIGLCYGVSGNIGLYSSIF